MGVDCISQHSQHESVAKSINRITDSKDFEFLVPKSRILPVNSSKFKVSRSTKSISQQSKYRYNRIGLPMQIETDALYEKCPNFRRFSWLQRANSSLSGQNLANFLFLGSFC